MVRLTRTSWPLLGAFALFIVVSLVTQAHVADLQALFGSVHPAVSIGLFVLLGILLVVIPFASILPFMPIAVALWGWPVTAALTVVAWVAGGQILFEVARVFGKPVVSKVLSPSQLRTFSRIVGGKGLLHAILIRLVVHGDMISYAFGLFTSMRRSEFLLTSAVGVLPAAVIYAYLGSMPFIVQVGLMGIGLGALGGVWLARSRRTRERSTAGELRQVIALP